MIKLVYNPFGESVNGGESRGQGNENECNANSNAAQNFL